MHASYVYVCVYLFSSIIVIVFHILLSLILATALFRCCRCFFFCKSEPQEKQRSRPPATPKLERKNAFLFFLTPPPAPCRPDVFHLPLRSKWTMCVLFTKRISLVLLVADDVVSAISNAHLSPFPPPSSFLHSHLYVCVYVCIFLSLLLISSIPFFTLAAPSFSLSQEKETKTSVKEEKKKRHCHSFFFVCV